MRLGVAVALGVLGVSLAGCRASSPRAAAGADEKGRFPHFAAPHAGLGCVTCHATEDVVAGRAARPGANDHAPCDGGECHADAFLAVPGPLCTICHAAVEPARAGGTTPAPYPPARGRRALAARFSHEAHLDLGAMEERVGFHVACGDCHTRPEGATEVTLPGHAACARCHDQAERGVSPPLTECGACHEKRAADPARARRLIKGDLRFHHASHELDRDGRPIACVTCHRGIANKQRTGKDAPPATSVCVACHDDVARTPAHAAMSQCATCHSADLGALGDIVAPRSHLPARDRPDDHTLAFRKDHAADAQRDAARCARCHSSMSGQARDNCAECHFSMRPMDHRISWAELDHGPEAATDPDRCATCHGGEFCTACHQVPPRSHRALDWCTAEHGLRARDQPRSCATCHGADRCADCHSRGVLEGTCGR